MQPNFIEGFVSKETATQIHEYLKTNVQVHIPDGPHPKGISHLSFHEKESYWWNGKSSEDHFMRDMLRLITESISSQFNLPKEKISLRTARYTLLTEGQSLRYHDDYQVSGHPVYSAVLYLTDDYDGGEISFYDRNEHGIHTPESPHTSYKPKAGTLVYFDGDEEHPHSVAEVLSGERANFVLFYEGEGTKPELKRLDQGMK